MNPEITLGYPSFPFSLWLSIIGWAYRISWTCLKHSDTQFVCMFLCFKLMGFNNLNKNNKCTACAM